MVNWNTTLFEIQASLFQMVEKQRYKDRNRGIRSFDLEPSEMKLFSDLPYYLTDWREVVFTNEMKKIFPNTNDSAKG